MRGIIKVTFGQCIKTITPVYPTPDICSPTKPAAIEKTDVFSHMLFHSEPNIKY